MLILAALLTARSAEPPGSDALRREQAHARDTEGVALAQSGKMAEAIERFRAALELDPAMPEAAYPLALGYEAAGKTDAAIEALEQALRIRPDFTEPRYALAGCCRKRGDFEGELGLLAEVVRRAPGLAEAHFNYGLALQRQEKPDQAIEQLRSAATLDARNPQYVLALGVALSRTNNSEGVEILRGAAALAPSNAAVHYNYALALASAGSTAHAIREFEAAIRLDPNHSDARRGLGVTLMHADRLEEAAEQFGRAVAIAPRDEEATNNLGLVQLRMKDIAAAIRSFERAITLNPRLIKAHANLAQAYQRGGRAEDARRQTQRAAELTAEQRAVGKAMILARTHASAAPRATPRMPLARCGTLWPRFGERSEAIREFRAVLNLDPERADAHHQIGLALLDAGDKGRALDELRAATAMAPCRIEIVRDLAQAAYSAPDWATAIGQYRRVLAWDHGDKSAQAQLERALMHHARP